MQIERALRHRFAEAIGDRVGRDTRDRCVWPQGLRGDLVETRRIARLVLISGAKMALIGCAIGVLGSLAISRLIASFLFNVSATDPLIYAVAAVVMILMTLAASALPATRAASTDPLDALRAN